MVYIVEWPKCHWCKCTDAYKCHDCFQWTCWNCLVYSTYDGNCWHARYTPVETKDEVPWMSGYRSE